MLSDLNSQTQTCPPTHHYRICLATLLVITTTLVKEIKGDNLLVFPVLYIYIMYFDGFLNSVKNLPGKRSTK